MLSWPALLSGRWVHFLSLSRLCSLPPIVRECVCESGEVVSSVDSEDWNEARGREEPRVETVNTRHMWAALDMDCPTDNTFIKLVGEILKCL